MTDLAAWPDVRAADLRRDYGGIGDGAHTARDTAALLAAIADLPRGGELTIPRGYWTINQPIVIPKAITIRGAGWGVPGVNEGCQIIQTVDGQDIFTIASPYVQIEDLSLGTTVATPTGGCGVRQTSGAFIGLSRIAAGGFYDNFRIDRGQGAFLDRLVATGPVRYGLLMANVDSADTGDSQLIGSYLGCAARGVSCLRYESFLAEQ